MRDPIVSFIVPCYKLAHLLPECINSIRSQSFSDFEVLIMDDCSPDNTAEVARSFKDPRVKHLRNDLNLGPLPNYNKGIRLSRGKYVWLISADDYLRHYDVLQRYVDLMDSNPGVGYVFCPGVGVKNGQEIETLEYSRYGNRDRIVNGHIFLTTLLNSCFVLAPSAMVRRECYEKISYFPLGVVWAGIPIDLIWGGDWYLWCVFALYFDVAYFAEPMVAYREHEISSTNIVTQNRIENCVLADIAVPWMIKHKADGAGFRKVGRSCLYAAANEYARHLLGKRYRSGTGTFTWEQFEESLCRNTLSEREKNWIRARVCSAVADRYYSDGDLSSAKQFYWAGLQRRPWMVEVCAKIFVLSLGDAGDYLRRFLRYVRND